MKKILLIALAMLTMSCEKDAAIEPIVEINLEPVSSGQIVRHTYYSLAYSEENEQASWVYYELSSEDLNGTQSRTDDFRADPAISTGSSSLNDFKSSGYDRGHLCPAADMNRNKIAMSESFFLSNMSPQMPGFNRGIWSVAEDQVREWTLKYQKLYVVTGPVFQNNIGTIGLNEVTIPGYYFKIIFDGKDHMIGLILPHASSTQSLDQFVVSIDQIEQQTGIDFFKGLDDQLEKNLEGGVSTSGWF